jgi:hypothetical protein
MNSLTANDRLQSDAHAEMALLTDVCEKLTRHGWPARLAHWSLCGELDVRLLVSCFGNGPDVELLGPYDGTSQSAQWLAVQVERDTRTAWAGPPRDCCEADLLRFVDQLLHPDAAMRKGGSTAKHDPEVARQALHALEDIALRWLTDEATHLGPGARLHPLPADRRGQPEQRLLMALG